MGIGLRNRVDRIYARPRVMAGLLREGKMRPGLPERAVPLLITVRKGTFADCNVMVKYRKRICTGH
jgi:hypothetical protein